MNGKILLQTFRDTVEGVNVKCINIMSTPKSPPIFKGNLLKNLKKYELKNCALVKIGLKNFNTLEFLSELIIQKTQLNAIPKDTFSSLTYLEHLNLFDNKISHLHENTFITLKNLKYLDISLNRLVLLPKNLFKENSKLEQISFAGNRLQVIFTDFLHTSNAVLNFENNPCTQSDPNGARSIQSLKELCYEPFFPEVSGVYNNEKYNDVLKKSIDMAKEHSKIQNSLLKINDTQSSMLLKYDELQEAINMLRNDFSKIRRNISDLSFLVKGPERLVEDLDKSDLILNTVNIVIIIFAILYVDLVIALLIVVKEVIL